MKMALKYKCLIYQKRLSNIILKYLWDLKFEVPVIFWKLISKLLALAENLFYKLYALNKPPKLFHYKNTKNSDLTIYAWKINYSNWIIFVKLCSDSIVGNWLEPWRACFEMPYFYLDKLFHLQHAFGESLLT